MERKREQINLQEAKKNKSITKDLFFLAKFLAVYFALSFFSRWRKKERKKQIAKRNSGLKKRPKYSDLIQYEYFFATEHLQ